MNTTQSNITVLNQSPILSTTKNSNKSNTKKKKNKIDEYLESWINKNKQQHNKIKDIETNNPQEERWQPRVTKKSRIDSTKKSPQKQQDKTNLNNNNQNNKSTKQNSLLKFDFKKIITKIITQIQTHNFTTRQIKLKPNNRNDNSYIGDKLTKLSNSTILIFYMNVNELDLNNDLHTLL